MIIIAPLQAPTYKFEQVVASNTWTINHNLGKFPSVEVVDTSYRMVLGGYVQYLGPNSLTITFNSEFSGYALLN